MPADLQHRALSGVQLHDSYHYVQSSDPGAVGAGKNWLDTSGSIWVPKRRNALDTAWVTVGNFLDPTTTTGDLIYRNSGGALARLGVGSAGQFLRSVSGLPAYQTVTLDTVPAAAADVDLNSKKIIGLADPTGAQHAATKAYVDSMIVAGTAWHSPTRVASTANVNISSAPASIDGVTLTSGDRVLLKDQTAGAENGIYVFNGSGSAMTRAVDADTASEILQAAMWVEEGTANADSAWVMTTNAPITLGTTALNFTKFAILAGAYTDPLTTKGDLVARTSGATVRLPVGTDGDVLTADSAASEGVSWQAPSGGGGGETLIFSSVLGSAAASIDTGATLSGSYTHLKVRVRARCSVSGRQELRMRFNGDSGSNKYGWALHYAGGSPAQDGPLDAGGNTFARIGAVTGSGGLTDAWSETVVEVFWYARTDGHKHSISRGTDVQTNQTSYDNFAVYAHQEWRDTAAINQIEVFSQSGNLIAGSILEVWAL